MVSELQVEAPGPTCHGGKCTTTTSGWLQSATSPYSRCIRASL